MLPHVRQPGRLYSQPTNKVCSFPLLSVVKNHSIRLVHTDTRLNASREEQCVMARNYVFCSDLLLLRKPVLNVANGAHRRSVSSS
jgi:hypothetical protein